MQDNIKNINWDATSFFEKLASKNKLAKEKHFGFFRVSRLEGFEEVLRNLQSTANFICVKWHRPRLHGAQHNTAHSKSEDGVLCHASRSWWYGSTSGVHGHHAWVIPSVYVCTHTRKTRVEEEHIYLDPRISFQEIDRYFLSGCACAFFQVATDVYTDLRYNQEEWD